MSERPVFVPSNSNKPVFPKINIFTILQSITMPYLSQKTTEQSRSGGNHHFSGLAKRHWVSVVSVLLTILSSWSEPQFMRPFGLGLGSIRMQ